MTRTKQIVHSYPPILCFCHLNKSEASFWEYRVTLGCRVRTGILLNFVFTQFFVNTSQVCLWRQNWKQRLERTLTTWGFEHKRNFVSKRTSRTFYFKKHSLSGWPSGKERGGEKKGEGEGRGGEKGRRRGKETSPSFSVSSRPHINRP